MHQSLLIRSLQVLNRKEMTRFKEMAYSPYFNKHEKVRKLTAYLSAIYPHFDAKTCNKIVIYEQLFEQEANTSLERQLSLVFNYTMQLLDTFWAEEIFKQDEEQQHIYILQQLRIKNQIKRYEKYLKKFDKQLKKTSIRNNEFYRHQFELAIEADNFYTIQSKHQKDLSIQNKQDNLDLYYLSEKLRDACEMTIRSKILQINYEVGMLETIVEEVQNNKAKYEHAPSIMVYYLIYLMLSKEDTKYYFELIPLLAESTNAFPKGELQHIYSLAQNFCIGQINTGNSDFMAELFKLYKAQLQNDLLLDEDGHLSEWHYKNIVTVGLRLTDFKWTKNFIETYKLKLNETVVENAYTFNLAAYYYSTQQYGKVQQLLLQVEYTDIRYSLDAKSLLLRTYFDLNEFDALDSLTDAFKMYLKRNKLISEQRREGYYNLLKFTKRAAHIKMNVPYQSTTKTQKAVAKIKADIEVCDRVFNLNWLVERVEGI